MPGTSPVPQGSALSAASTASTPHSEDGGTLTNYASWRRGVKRLVFRDCKRNVLAICRLDTGATVAAAELSYPLPFHHIGFFFHVIAEQTSQRSSAGRNRTTATFCQWSKPTPAGGPRGEQTKEWGSGSEGSEDGGGGSVGEGGAAGGGTQTTSRLGESYLFYIWNTPFFFSPSIPMKSCRKRLLQRGQARRKWCGTARGPITQNPSLHPGYGWAVLPQRKWTFTPWMDQPKRRDSSRLVSFLGTRAQDNVRRPGICQHARSSFWSLAN